MEHLSHVALQIVDVDSGLDLGPGETGEVCMRGPQVMPRYHNQPQATADTIDPQGWLHTGDPGHANTRVSVKHQYCVTMVVHCLQ